jgi:BolA protein
MTARRTAEIQEALQRAFAPTRLDVHDESAAHVGHAGAAGGAGHFRVRIVSPRFTGVGARERHRLVYEALAGLLERDIHALSIEARAPSEVT